MAQVYMGAWLPVTELTTQILEATFDCYSSFDRIHEVKRCRGCWM